MDRPREQLSQVRLTSLLRRIILWCAALFILAAAAPRTAPILIRDQAWTPASAQRAYILTHSPGECMAARTPETEIGRALFRTPVLIGGPAARAGISCNACHSDGRINTHFLLPELTDRAGAADVTSEWASRVRGDGIANPRDIPDLVGVGQRVSFGHLNDPSLDHFVGGVIEEEFQGQPPPPQAFAGVIAYLRALDANACPAAETPVTLSHTADDVHRALAAAQSANGPTAGLLLYAAQDGVGRIVERLPRSRFGRDRRTLQALSRDLGALRGDPTALLEPAAPAWNARFDAVIARIARRERQTYFNEATLRDALEQ